MENKQHLHFRFCVHFPLVKPQQTTYPNHPTSPSPNPSQALSLICIFTLHHLLFLHLINDPLLIVIVSIIKFESIWTEGLYRLLHAEEVL